MSPGFVLPEWMLYGVSSAQISLGVNFRRDFHPQPYTNSEDEDAPTEPDRIRTTPDMLASDAGSEDHTDGVYPRGQDVGAGARERQDGAGECGPAAGQSPVDQKQALNIHQPDLPIELTIEPLMKKTVNANVLKGRFVLPNPVPSPASQSSAQNQAPGKDVIAVILDDQSPDDVRLARDLGVDHFGGQNLLDRILAEEIKPTKLLVHTRSPKIQNMFTSAESKKTMFKTLAGLNLVIPSEKRGTMSEDLRALIINSKASIDWLVKKKPCGSHTPSGGQSASSPTKTPQAKTAKNSHNHIDSFIAIPIGSIQMNLVHLEQNISDFLSMVSNLTQFGTSSSSSVVSPKATTPSSSSSSSSTGATNNNQPRHRATFKSGRPIKKPGIYKATLSVKGIPAITVI